MNENIKQEAKTLEEAARPLVEYIRKHHTPMTTAIVTGASVEILSTDIQVPFDDDWDERMRVSPRPFKTLWTNCPLDGEARNLLNKSSVQFG